MQSPFCAIRFSVALITPGAIGLHPVLAWNLAKRFLIRREKFLDGELPREFLLDSPSAKFSHPRPLFRMIKKPHYFRGKITYIVSTIAV